MPKKMGTNTKAVEARERKQAVKKEAKIKAEQAAADRMWQDDDKTLAKKKQRKEEEERKRLEVARRKAEAKALLTEEMSSIQTQGKQSMAKINRLAIQEEMEKRNRNAELTNAPKATSKLIVKPPPLEENLNHAMEGIIVATDIDQALEALSVHDGEDRHPERRMKAAFKKFQSENLPRVRAENPTLRASQWSQILIKEWKKSPQNPLNQFN